MRHKGGYQTVSSKGPYPQIHIKLFADEPLDNMWSLSITKSIRMVYRLMDHDIGYFVDIGTHDEVYRK